MPPKNKRAESRCRYYAREQAGKRGWNVKHPSRSGEVLEEQEIQDYFPDIGLFRQKPDFLFVRAGLPIMVVEAKNEAGKLDEALQEAIEYANLINKQASYNVRIAVGAAGEEDKGFEIGIRVLDKNNNWLPLKSHGFELTSFPTKQEIELASQALDGTTNVSVPDAFEFIDSALEISKILRSAKIEAPVRPRVIGALVLAIYETDLSITQAGIIEDINNAVNKAIDASDHLSDTNKQRLKETLFLSLSDFDRLKNYVGRIINELKRLNVRSVIHTDIDFLGLFYEAFLRYGYDNNALGIVFTPRHITRLSVELSGLSHRDKVIDIACGTGGFLVSALDRMLNTASGPASISRVKQSIYGFDTNPTVWALAMLNMFFRGDGKSHLHNESSLDTDKLEQYRQTFTRAYLNPPFSQDQEPEHLFIDRSMDFLEPDGILVAVVKAGIFADDQNKNWRRNFLRKHRLIAMISLPEDLFYPTAAPTSIVIAHAHTPIRDTDRVFMGRIWNDGYKKLKGKRVEVPNESQIPELIDAFTAFQNDIAINSSLFTVITGDQLKDGSEWSPQEWLPQPEAHDIQTTEGNEAILKSIFQAVSMIPELADEVKAGFLDTWQDLPDLPYGTAGQISKYFHIINGRSSGEKNYSEGETPYISSGDGNNSIVRLVQAEENEIFQDGGITVTAFGFACVQPWKFVARGNGGSAVRILIPRYRMSLAELSWFAAQINSQRWRFFYARMAIMGRISQLKVSAPRKGINSSINLHENIQKFRQMFESFTKQQ